MAENGQYDAMVGAYSRFVRENPSTPILHWHHGRALYARADRLRRDGSFSAAVQAFAKAEAAFGEYAAMVPSHAAAADQWRGLCCLQQALTAVPTGIWWTALWPGLAMFVLVLGLSFLGEGLEQWLSSSPQREG